MTSNAFAAQNSAQVQTLVQDWQTIWQSEMAAIACDREMLESVAASAQLWQAFEAIIRDTAHARHTSPRAEAGSPPGATPVAAASGVGGDEAESERLRARVAELERRLAELDGAVEPKRARRKAASKRA